VLFIMDILALTWAYSSYRYMLLTLPTRKRLHRLSSSHTRRLARRSRVATRSRAIGSLRSRCGATRSAASR
jgi:hypothetical protein